MAIAQAFCPASCCFEAFRKSSCSVCLICVACWTASSICPISFIKVVISSPSLVAIACCLSTKVVTSSNLSFLFCKDRWVSVISLSHHSLCWASPSCSDINFATISSIIRLTLLNGSARTCSPTCDSTQLLSCCPALLSQAAAWSCRWKSLPGSTCTNDNGASAFILDFTWMKDEPVWASSLSAGPARMLLAWARTFSSADRSRWEVSNSAALSMHSLCKSDSAFSSDCRSFSASSKVA
mmetsp:Transcript_48040/g.127298  ORF Transcript_48040/g.127298 Transcript_48040/m.127298 type:complete len:239 (+) Transcript_48040:549-1265(+)